MRDLSLYKRLNNGVLW